jgi:hypothetical protein
MRSAEGDATITTVGTASLSGELPKHIDITEITKRGGCEVGAGDTSCEAGGPATKTTFVFDGTRYVPKELTGGRGLTGALQSESLRCVSLRRSVWGLGALLLCSCDGSLSTVGLEAGVTDGAASDGNGPSASLRGALAGAWSFDVDGKDHSGNALDLGIAGLRLATGRFGKGLQLAGEGTPIAQRPIDDPSLNLTMGDFTVSFWISFSMTGAAQFVAVKGYNDGGWFVGWARTAWAYGLPSPAGGTFSDPAGSPAPGVFHHVVFERSVDTVELFVDSKSVGTATVHDAPAPAQAPFQVGGFAPGGVSVAMGQSVVNGVVDDLAIWRRALVADERAYLATHAVP